MSWAAVTSSVATFAAVAGNTVSWTTSTVAVVPPAWGHLTSVVSTDDGVDFRLALSQDFPMYLSADRPVVIYDIHPEGTP